MQIPFFKYTDFFCCGFFYQSATFQKKEEKKGKKNTQTDRLADWTNGRQTNECVTLFVLRVVYWRDMNQQQNKRHANPAGSMKCNPV